MSERSLTKNLQLARLLLTALLAGGVVASFVLDWSANHLLHPDWHPHARFHGALLLFFLGGASAACLWLMWRDSTEPAAGIRASAVVAISFWMPLFYIPFVLPGSTWWAGTPGAEPRWAGQIVYPNLIVAGLCILVALAALRLCSSKS